MDSYNRIDKQLKESKSFLKLGEYDLAWSALSISKQDASAFVSSVLFNWEYCKQRTRILMKEKKYEFVLYYEVQLICYSVLWELSKFPFGCGYSNLKIQSLNGEFPVQSKQFAKVLRELNLTNEGSLIINDIKNFCFTELVNVFGVSEEVLEKE